MDVASIIVVFLLTWWMVLFMVLPWGLERDEDGTPRNPNLRKKLLITTAISIAVTTLITVLVEADLVSFREASKAMGL